jgi:hypothetical protein
MQQDRRAAPCTAGMDQNVVWYVPTARLTCGKPYLHAMLDLAAVFGGAVRT